VLQAAAALERAKAQRINQEEQAALQKGSLAVAVLSQIPRDDELNKPVLAGRTRQHEFPLEATVRRGSLRFEDVIRREKSEISHGIRPC
jgi:hypothetical protein